MESTVWSGVLALLFGNYIAVLGGHYRSFYVGADLLYFYLALNVNGIRHNYLRSIMTVQLIILGLHTFLAQVQILYMRKSIVYSNIIMFIITLSSFLIYF